MLCAGILTTMNVFVDSYKDINFSLNDIYMTLLMTGWMFLFMGIIYKETKVLLFGLLLIIINFYFIRTQFMISERQYVNGMIPHHSMAIHMSKQLKKKDNNIDDFLENIIVNQTNEINYLKDFE
jgi:hypothetical protein